MRGGVSELHGDDCCCADCKEEARRLCQGDKVCESQPHCLCLAPAGDGLDSYQCCCSDDGTWRCRSCGAGLVTVPVYEQNAVNMQAHGVSFGGGD